MEEVILLKVASKFKNEVSKQLENLSLLESEALVRIGLHGLNVFFKECPVHNNDVSKLKEEYERLITDKNKEYSLLSEVLLKEREAYALERCKEYQDEVARYKVRMENIEIENKKQLELMNAKLRESQLSEVQRQDDVIHKYQEEVEYYKLRAINIQKDHNQERDSIQIETKKQLELMTEKLRESQLSSVKTREDVINKFQEEIKQLQTRYQEDVLKLKEDIIKLTEQLSVSEQMKYMEVQSKVSKTVEEYKEQQKDNYNMEIERQKKLYKDRYTTIIEQMKAENEVQTKKYGLLLEQYRNTETELVRLNEAKLSMESTSEIVIRNRVNDLFEEKRIQYSTIIEELKASVEEYKRKCKDIELEYIQRDSIALKNLQKELHDTKEQLSRAALDNEATKVKSLMATVELQQNQINEIINKRQSSVLLGQQGETYFRELIEETFSGYDSFELIDMTKTPHSGDFHLKFREFSILTDSKNFVRGKVSSTDINKFHYDMSRNAGIKVGWLVCLHGYVGSYAKQPFVFEIRDGKLLVYINNLKNVDSPKQLLEEVFYSCQFLYNTMINVESTSQLLANYKRYERHVNEVALRLVKQNKQINATMSQLKNDLLENEKIVNDIIRADMLNVRNDHSTMVEEWFHVTTELSDGSKIKSNTLYELFTTANSGTSITLDMFKSILKSIIPSDQLQLPKLEKSQYILVGYKLKA
jgi:hypothetical protein